MSGRPARNNLFAELPRRHGRAEAGFMNVPASRPWGARRRWRPRHRRARGSAVAQVANFQRRPKCRAGRNSQRPSLLLRFRPARGTPPPKNSLLAVIWKEQRAFFQGFLYRICCALMPALIQGERNKQWPSTGGYGRFWSYGALAAIASARRRETERTPDSEGYKMVRKPCRTIYPAPDENSDETRPAPQVDLRQKAEGAGRKRSADFRATAPSRGVGQGAARNGP